MKLGKKWEKTQEENTNHHLTMKDATFETSKLTHHFCLCLFVFFCPVFQFKKLIGFRGQKSWFHLPDSTTQSTMLNVKASF